MGLFNGNLSRAISGIMGDSVREPFLMDLGNPFTGAVEIRLEDGAEMPGLVWVHAHTNQTTAISGDFTSGDDDKVSPTRALLKPNLIPLDMQVYGTPVYVKQLNGNLEIFDLGGVAAVEYLYGLKAHPQKSIDVSQFDYGLLRPTAPPGATVLMSGFKPTLDSVAYDVPALQSIDLIATYAGGAEGQAKAVLIECDPILKALHYTASSLFTDTTHDLAFPNYPKAVTRGRFLLGWVKLYFGIVAINITDIYPGQELYSKESTAGTAALAALVVDAGEIVTAGGEPVWEFS